MRGRILLATLISALAVVTASDAVACGDKFLVGNRGTRYQRPKNARAASIVIYSNPAPDDAALSARVQSMLSRHGHRATIVTTLDQLTAVLSGSRFDLILAASDMAVQVQRLIEGSPDASAVLAMNARPNATRLLSAIDQAVEARDQRQRTRTSS